jgi:hypothetical protein
MRADSRSSNEARYDIFAKGIFSRSLLQHTRIIGKGQDIPQAPSDVIVNFSVVAASSSHIGQNFANNWREGSMGAVVDES